MIKNKKQLSTSSLRKDAVAIIDAGYEAIHIEKLIKRRMKLRGRALFVEHLGDRQSISLPQFKRVALVGFGKGAYTAISTMADILGRSVSLALALDVKNFCRPSRPNKKVRVFFGTHPKPSHGNVRATQEIVRMLETLEEEDLVIFYVGGGGSSLLCGSGDEMDASSKVFDVLTSKGVNIADMNVVRKHLSSVKGGWLSYFAYPATVLSLIVSDVCGNDFSTIASGPTVHDPTTIADAKKILKTHNVSSRGVMFVETPKDRRYFKNTTNVLFACNQDALGAMMAKSRSLGYRTRLVSLAYEGDAHTMFAPLLKKIKKGEALLLGGETTVHLSKKHGRGGRNQEAVLAAVASAYEGNSDLSHSLVASVGSDGYDNTPVAGALADAQTMRALIGANIDPIQYLSSNDSYAFFKKVGGHIEAYPHSFNVSDLMVVMREKE